MVVSNYTETIITKKPVQSQGKASQKEKDRQYISNKNDEKIKSTPGVNTNKCYHHGFKGTDMAQQYIQYACEVSSYDIDFILTLQHENGSRDIKKQSNVVKNGKRERSFGLCQMMWDYHKKDVYENLPYNRIFESKYLNDRKYQIDVCYKKYVGGTRFYGYDHRYKGNKGLIEINGKFY